MSIKGFNIGGTTYKVDYPELDNLPQINGNDLVGDLDAESLGLDQVYWAIYRMTTNAEIEAALNDGKIVLCRVPNPLALLDPPVVCRLTQRNSATNHRFAAITTGAEILLYVAYCINNSWTSGVFKLATDASVPDPDPNPAAPLGTASAGSSNTYSRGDHVHAMPSAEDVGAIADPDTKASGQVLTYNGYSWVARTPSGGGLSQEAKSALMDCFAHVAWADANGQTYYNALAVALGLRVLTSISATYTQSGTVYDTDTLDSLKADLVVTAVYSDSSTQTVPAADYTLSGTLTVGTTAITVSYGGKTTTFDVTVVHRELLFVGASYGAGTSNGTVTFNQDGTIRLASTGQTNWGLCFSPYGSASAFKTWGELKGHTVRLVYKITWAGKTATTRLSTAAHICSDLSRYDMTRLRYSTFIDTNTNPSFLEDKEGYIDLLVPSDASGWDGGTASVTDSNYFCYRTYLISNTAGADVTVDYKFYDMGVLS